MEEEEVESKSYRRRSGFVYIDEFIFVRDEFNMSMGYHREKSTKQLDIFVVMGLHELRRRAN